ncbi:MAG: hypothetical protein INR64_13295 [Caulobacteraceae bacterium]|nr:hypothetical protein [Caulobacter sp.]
MTARAWDPPGIDGWPAAAAVAGFLLMLVMPPALLTLMHLNYDAPSGAAWEKVHPGSDVMLLAFAGAALRSGDPRAWLLAQLRRFPGAMMLLAVTLFMTAYLIMVLHAPFTPLIDTFVVPVAAIMVVAGLVPLWQARLEAALHLFVAVNALLGIAEFVTGFRLIPAEIDGVAQTAEVESRAFGFLGHPLASAAMAGLYAVVLMLGGGRRLPDGWRLPALGLQALALGAFGGRTALVMAGLFAVLAGGLGVLRFLAGRPTDIRRVAAILLLAPVALATLAGVALGGFFDTVLNRFVDDNGSALARHAILDLFGFLSWSDLLFGPDQDYLASARHMVGIEVGIESFWLGFILQFGLLPSLVFFAGFAGFVADVLRRCVPAAVGPLAFFIVIISSSISLSAKSTMLVQFAVVVLILMPRHFAPAPRGQPRQGLVPVLP